MWPYFFLKEIFELPFCCFSLLKNASRFERKRTSFDHFFKILLYRKLMQPILDFVDFRKMSQIRPFFQNQNEKVPHYFQIRSTCDLSNQSIKDYENAVFLIFSLSNCRALKSPWGFLCYCLEKYQSSYSNLFAIFALQTENLRLYWGVWSISFFVLTMTRQGRFALNYFFKFFT